MIQLLVLVLIAIPSLGNASPPPLVADSIYQSNTKWTDQTGKELTLKEFRGKAIAISMVYMSCKHTCPMTVARMKEIEKELGSDKKNVRFVLVSFDPKRDTPDVMRKFAEKHELPFPDWMFITSQQESHLRELSSLIDFKYRKVAEDEFEHSYGVVALDPQGRVIGRIEGSEMKPKELAKKMRKSLKN